MSGATTLEITEVNPLEAWEALQNDPASVLVDVRTIAEWDYVGEPVLDSLGKELLKVEWMEFPEMTRNTFFAEEVFPQLADDTTTVFLICRSGRRSLNAARCLAEKIAENGRDIKCVNVAEGFEGDQDAEHHRGTLNGWKVRGLPWKQA